MKALLIVTLVNGLSVEPTPMQDMQTCLAQIEPLTKQVAIKDAACVPFVAKPSMEEKFRIMMGMFLDLIDTIEAKQYAKDIESGKWKHENALKCGPNDSLANESPSCIRDRDDADHWNR